MQTQTISTSAVTVTSLSELDKQIKALQAQKKIAKSAPREFNPKANFSEYKGHKTIELLPFPSANAFNGKFSFGLQKARLIIALLPEIQKFITENSK